MVKIAIKSKADENILALIEKEIVIKKLKMPIYYSSGKLLYSTNRDVNKAIEWLNEAEK
jgi:hypothetical protein